MTLEEKLADLERDRGDTVANMEHAEKNFHFLIRTLRRAIGQRNMAIENLFGPSHARVISEADKILLETLEGKIWTNNIWK